MVNKPKYSDSLFVPNAQSLLIETLSMGTLIIIPLSSLIENSEVEKTIQILLARISSNSSSLI